MADRIRRNFRSSGVRRATKWLGGADPTAKTTLAAATAVLAQSFTSAQIDVLAPAGGTIVRTRGILWVASDQVVSSEEPIGALGMMVVRDQARIAGVGSIPTPVTESPDDGFFLHQWMFGGIMFAQQDATGVNIWNGWHRYDFDSKAQRKFTGDDAIVVTLENSSASHGLAFLLAFRMLVKPGVSG